MVSLDPRRRALLADAAGLALITFVLLDYFRPSLLLTPTIAAGGDTPCHYPTFVEFHQRLLPQLRLHGWYPGAYLGHPLLLYYFPLPFLAMSALVPALGLPAAFKVGSVLGVFLLPLATYASFRLMGFRSPAPLSGAAAATVFLFCEENPIWGGTIASTLTGEFAYAYGTALAVLFLGVVYRAYAHGRGPWWPAAVLGITALAHGYAVLWAGLAATFFLYGTRRPARTFGWLAAVALIAFALAAVSLLPLLASWGWTTPYDDPWITVTARNLFPPVLWALFGVAAVGLVWTLVAGRSEGGADRRLLFLAHAALVAAALAAAGPAFGIIDVRFVPFAQLALCLLGGATLGLLFERLAAPRLAALALVVVALLYGDAASSVARSWIDWNETGLEAKELWPAFREVAERLRGRPADPRIAVEYAKEHERAGSIRVYETMPLFTGRPTLEGVYNQASVLTHPVYYLASELGAMSPNPFRKRDYSRMDTPGAVHHLRLFNARDVVAVSPELERALEGRSDATRVLRVPPYTAFRLDGDWRYVEPMAYAPVRSSPRDWPDKSYRWFTRKPPSRAHLVFTDDPRIERVEADEWLPPPEVPLPGGVIVEERVEPEAIAIRTSRVGHPLLVKVSYHPRWRADGADGPYLVTPGLMMVVPRQVEVHLVYARDGSDRLGAVLTLAALAGAALAFVLDRRRRALPAAEGAAPARVPLWVRLAYDACDPDDLPPSPRRWGAAVPVAIVLALVSARFIGARETRPDPAPLYERASRAYAEGRYADAAEYARHALPGAAGSPLAPELETLRGESLLRSGQPLEAATAFQVVVDTKDSPYAAQALFGLASARAAAGDPDGARAARERLQRDHSQSPWAERALREATASPAP
jgi:hypothetical protein